MGTQKRPPVHLPTLRGDDTDASDREAALEGRGDWPVSRRSFLRGAGFAFAGTALLGCERGRDIEAVPYGDAPDGITTGRAVRYATTCGACSAGCGILTRSRDGRPIKLEGNPDHPLSRGGLCAVGQASILSLYDSKRLHHPTVGDEKFTWTEVDRTLGEKLARIRRDRGAVRLLSSTITSPTTRALVGELLATFGDGKLVEWDALSSSAILDAHERTHGARLLPHVRFERAEVVASFDADFLGTWVSPVEHTVGWRAARDLSGTPPRCSRVVQFESRMSLTGARADERVAVAPSELGTVALHLADLVARKAGRDLALGTLPETPHGERLGALAEALWAARGKAVVVSGSDDVDVQVLVAFVNEALGAYGTTLDLAAPSQQRRGSDSALLELVEDMKAGRVAALFVAGCNPLYELPDSLGFAEGLGKVGVSVSFASHLDETAAQCTFTCPDHHPLESWNDAEPVAGVLSVAQPTLRPLFGTRALRESLSAWMGQGRSDYELLRSHWRANVFPRQSAAASFQAFWDKSVHDGFAVVSPIAATPAPAWNPAVEVRAPSAAPGGDELALVLYPKVGMRAGEHAHNPWLQELPDPISKCCWDNYACLSPEHARELGVVQGDVVEVKAAGHHLELPVVVIPGQHPSVVAVALGYGRKGTDRFAGIGPEWISARQTLAPGELVGKRVARWLRAEGGTLRASGLGAKVKRTGRTALLACSQDYHSLKEPEGIGHLERPMVVDMTFEQAARGEPPRAHHLGGPGPTMWPADHPKDGHRWGLVVDLAACTGCGGCVIGCQAENNVPVVGKDEVFRHREMHWMRIDRYFDELPDGGVRVSQQPVMCQHCENAPCETVCPVLATVHSEEGLNQQVYNRCVGTRYCANNCPYKVRRFNWFDYRHEDVVENMVLNPDVTIRTRGIMEKCSFCVQRIQERKHEARRLGVPVRGDDIQTACQESCPAKAITFGDLNDPEGAVLRRREESRGYRMLEELNIGPSVTYLAMVRNPLTGRGGEGHG
jgi:molybdopterin-containing oxidoreductase family iron-sulfur binding subunit